MGWADCGTDSAGRPIGYSFRATCDHPGCKTRIHRGLAYVCGDMHGSDEHSCEGYFCDDHGTPVEVEPGRWLVICEGCAAEHEQGVAGDG